MMLSKSNPASSVQVKAASVPPLTSPCHLSLSFPSSSSLSSVSLPLRLHLPRLHLQLQFHPKKCLASKVNCALNEPPKIFAYSGSKYYEAVEDGRKRLKVEISIPELNPAMDVYRIGTLMELIRVIALSFADDGKRVKVCVQGSMGEGSLTGMPLQLAGTRKILKYMDWGNYEAKGTFIKIGTIGGKEVEEEDDMFILVAPQNAVGNCIIDDLKAMTDAAGNRPVILINPRLKDVPGSSGIMQRLEYAASFESCYHFRLLFYAGTQYPIMGALRMAYPYKYQVYKRVDEEGSRKERYVMLTTFEKQPDPDEINDAFLEKPRKGKKTPGGGGIWGFLTDLLN